MREGFALAAAAHSDRGAALAEPGLASQIAAQAAQIARELAARNGAERRRWVTAVLPPPAGPRADLTAVPARALALLATAVPRDVGRSWLAAAPLPRPGYVPDAHLLAVLRKLAARGPA